jgi:hypothetical protein
MVSKNINIFVIFVATTFLFRQYFKLAIYGLVHLQFDQFPHPAIIFLSPGDQGSYMLENTPG